MDLSSLISIRRLCLKLVTMGQCISHVTVVVYMDDHGSNLIGCQSNNLIYDKCLYDVKFVNCGVIMMTGNVIMQAIYALCKIDGNEYY